VGGPAGKHPFQAAQARARAWVAEGTVTWRYLLVFMTGSC
jgi:hypothetical protein